MTSFLTGAAIGWLVTNGLVRGDIGGLVIGILLAVALFVP